MRLSLSCEREGTIILRKIFFWLHLTAGVLAGLVIFLMSVTGVLLAFERQIVAYAERDLRATAAEAARPAWPLSRVVEAARKSAPDAKPSNVVLRADRLAPVTVALGRGRTLFVNPYTGATSEGAKGVRKFFETNVQLHRWLAMKDEARERGKAVTGASNAMFLFIVLSGLVIWIPRKRAALRNALFFRGGLRGKARDFNWHHVFGIWAFVPLVAIVFSAMVISYPWASRLVYRAFGSTPPPQQQQPQQNERGGGRGAGLEALDRLANAARTEAARLAPRWQSLSVRLPLPGKGPVTVSLDEGNGARPDKRSQLMLDPKTAQLVEHKTYAKQEAGQQARAWLRWIHTGEAGGIAGQFVAMLASAAAMALVYTGLALAIRRFARFIRGGNA